MLSTVLLFLSIASTSLSTPVLSTISKQTSDNSFSIKANLNSGFIRHGPSALLYALNKHNLELPEGLAHAANLHKRQSGEVAATPNGADLQYLCPVSIGGQTLNLNFDSGSADLWVFSTNQPTTQTTGHSVYNPSLSTTYLSMTGYTFAISYGDGSSASGTVGTDIVTIGGISVPSQAVGLASDVSTTFTANSNSDGILGLALSSINSIMPDYQNTFFENAIPSLKSGLFTADLRHLANGTFDFGYIDKKKYQGSISYAPLDPSRGFWGFSANKGYYVGTKHYADAAPNGAIADTGTTLILLSDAMVNKYYASVKGAIYSASSGGWIFPCKSTLPNLQLSVGKKYATIPGSLINYSTVSKTMCYGGLQSLGPASLTTPYIYGDIFFKSVFTIFDLTNSRIGFAAKSKPVV